MGPYHMGEVNIAHESIDMHLDGLEPRWMRLQVDLEWMEP